MQEGRAVCDRICFYGDVVGSFFSSCQVVSHTDDEVEENVEETKITGGSYIQEKAKGQKFYFYNESFSKGKKI